MALLQTLKSLVNERLSAAAEEIFGTVEHILTEYEDEALSLKQEIDRKSRLLDMVLKPYIKVHRAGWYNLFENELSYFKKMYFTVNNMWWTIQLVISHLVLISMMEFFVGMRERERERHYVLFDDVQR